MEKERFDISGMHCAACSARVERSVASLPGAADVSVNLLTNSLSLSYDEALLGKEDIIRAVEEAGYGAAPHRAAEKAAEAAPAADLAAAETRSLKRRLLVSLVFTLPLFYLAMGHMFHWPLPALLQPAGHPFLFSLTQFLLLLPVLIAGGFYYRSGFAGILRRAPNMDSLVALGTSAAVVYGLYALLRIAYGFETGDAAAISLFSMQLYFESAGMILTLITLGKYLEARAKGRTSEAISKLMSLRPSTALLLKDGKEQEIPLEAVQPGDILAVKAGAAVPVDGTVTKGYAVLDESMLTGESLPVEKDIGGAVIGGTVSRGGYFEMEARAAAADNTLSKIIALVEEATASKAPISRLADKVSGIFVPVVMGIALLTALVWLLLGQSVQFTLTAAISVLIISCPCALGLATPTAIMVGTGRGAGSGILIKSAEILERLHSVSAVVFDKTGTITTGEPAITDILPQGGITREELLSLAASLELPSSHPLAEPIVRRAQEEELPLLPVSELDFLPGMGLRGTVEGRELFGGNRRILSRAGVEGDWSALEDSLAAAGKTPLYFAERARLLGIIALADPLRDESAAAVSQLQAAGISVHLLSGDHERTARAIAAQLGIEQVMAEVFPDQKLEEIQALQQAGHVVCMVGDGINDAPALAGADIGMAIGAGTEVAIESADVVLMKSDPGSVAEAIALSRAVMRNIRQNLFWAFFYNCIGIPIAALGLLNPMVAAAAMSASSVCVVSNALRLRRMRILPARSNKPGQNHLPESKEEEFTMTTQIQIEGMNCAHCVASVEKALSALPGVEAVQVSLEEQSARLSLTQEIDPALLQEAVEGAGFTFRGLK